MRIMLRCPVCDVTDYPEPCFPNGNPVLEVGTEADADDATGGTWVWERVPDDTPLWEG